MCLKREENASRQVSIAVTCVHVCIIIQVKLPNTVATTLSSKSRVKIVFVLNQHSVQTLSSSGVGHVHM